MDDEIFEVAIFDDGGILREVKRVNRISYKTDPQSGQMRLPRNHNVFNMIGKYRISRRYDSLEPIIDKFPRNIFFETLGVTLVRWQPVEIQLFELFLLLSGISARKVAFEIFNAQPLGVQRRTIRKIMSALSFRQDIVKEWGVIDKKIESISKKRNRIAHEKHIIFGPIEGNFENYLHSGDISASKNRKQLIDTKFLEEAAEEFGWLARQIAEYLPKIRASMES